MYCYSQVLRLYVQIGKLLYLVDDYLLNIITYQFVHTVPLRGNVALARNFHTRHSNPHAKLDYSRVV